MLDKKSQLELLKKQQAELLRQEKVQRKNQLEFEMQAIEAERRAKLSRLEEIEKQFNVFKATRQTSFSKLSETQKKQKIYLDQLKQMQNNAKDLLINQPFSMPVYEDHSLNEINLRKINRVAPVKIPVLLPHSELQKKQKIQPAAVQRVFKNGDVCSVYIVDNSVPAFNPLVKAELRLDRDEIGKDGVVHGEVRYNDQRKWKSISPQRKRKEDLELSKPESVNLRQLTPQMKSERYNYRDYSFSEVSGGREREWVKKRMEKYSKFIQSDFKPRVSERKKMELEMIKEKFKKYDCRMKKKFKLI